MDFSDYSRQKLEGLWRVRLQAARQEHSLAVGDFQKVGQEWCAQMQPPDGFVMSEALKRQARARAKYVQVLRIFTDLVVVGKRPPGPLKGDEK